MKYFSLHFERYLQRIQELEVKIAEDARQREASREEKLTKKIVFARSKRSFTPLEEVARSNPYEAELMQVRLDLADTQNNLMYRLICYYNLDATNSYQEGLKILRKFFPKLEQNLTTQLEKYKL